MRWLLCIPRAFWRALVRGERLNLQRLAASVAFYALFSLPALLVVAIDLAGAVYGEAAARGRLTAEIARYLGDDLAATVDSVIARAVAAGMGGFLPRALSYAALCFGASLTFVEIQHGLNQMWGTESARRWYVALVLKRLVSFAMVLVAGALLMASMATSLGIARAGAWLAEHLSLPLALGVIRWLEPGVALAALAILFVLVFKVLPDGRVPWKRAWVGAVVTAVLLVAAKALVGQYLGAVDVTSAYGAAGSLVVLLVWIYTSSAVVLLGGAFAFAWEEVRGAPRAEAGPGAPVPAA